MALMFDEGFEEIDKSSRRRWMEVWKIKCLDYIMMSLFVTVDASETRKTFTNFFRESLIILHCQKGINIVHRLNVNSLECV